jgi:hypothetical protein
MLNALILQLFGIYAADILVIVTAVLAGLTGFYAIQTMKTVQIMERAAKMEFLPRIKGHIHMNGPVNLDFRISNVGKGPAEDVRVNFTVVGQNTVTRTWTQPLLKPNGFQDFFIPISETETESSVPYSRNNETRVELNATYRDILDINHSNSEVINISDFVNQFERTLSVYSEETSDKISRSLDKFFEELQRIRQNLAAFRSTP